MWVIVCRANLKPKGSGGGRGGKERVVRSGVVGGHSESYVNALNMALNPITMFMVGALERD